LAGFRTPLGGGKQQQATRNVALNATIGFRFGTDGFVVDFGPEGVLPRRADPGGCALTVAATPMSLASVVYGGRRVADAEAEGELTLTGDRQLFDRFVTWFPLPEKIG
jgi:hypothetical protein